MTVWSDYVKDIQGDLTVSFDDPTQAETFLSRGVQGAGVDVGVWGVYDQEAQQKARNWLNSIDNQKFVLETEGRALGVVTAQTDNGMFKLEGGQKALQRLRDAVDGSGIKIPEKIAKYRAYDDYKAGGQFQVDQSIDDANDALAALGNPSFSLKPVDSLKTTAQNVAENEKVQKVKKVSNEWGSVLTVASVAISLGLVGIAYLGGKR